MQLAFAKWSKDHGHDRLTLRPILARFARACNLDIGTALAPNTLSLFEASKAWQSAFTFTTLVEFKTCTECREAHASVWQALNGRIGSKDPTVRPGPLVPRPVVDQVYPAPGSTWPEADFTVPAACRPGSNASQKCV
jgi:hypothetical protein